MKKYFGDKAFYKMALAVVLPIMLQNGITNFVSLLDNIMVGRVGLEEMTGVSIANQLQFVYNLAIFGIVSGAGIFCAQYFGCKDMKGVRNAFRVKLIFCLILCVVGVTVFAFAGEELMSLYLKGNSDDVDPVRTLESGRAYLNVMMIGMVPFAIVQAYSGTLRETGETMLPMKAGVAAVVVNLGLNSLLIYGLLGFPRLGVVGAAIATTVSRFVELAIVVIYAHKNTVKHPYMEGLYKEFKVPGTLLFNIFVKGTPLMLNEFLWSLGITTLLQCYSIRGLSVVAAMNISSTLSNVFNVVYIALGTAISIIVGQLLGAGKIDEAKDTDRKLIVFALLSCFGVGILLALVAPLFPHIYEATDEVRTMATKFILIAAMCMPIQGFLNACYFTIRSGGKTLITFLFDSFYVWVFSIPLAYVLGHYTLIPIATLYLICQLSDLIKCVIGFILVKRGKWAQNMVLNTK
ncbi:MAG: MATE family efflux transporter [Lachnospiraceae bacterium]|nr:MATE family efflux transporter [Lachnospiraceae bacterium]